MTGLGDRDRAVSVFIQTLGSLPGIGPRSVQNILVMKHAEICSAGLLDEAFARGLEIKAVDKALAREGVSWNACEQAAGEIMERAEREGLSVLNPFMPEYPQRLLRNRRFPPVLFVRGDAAALNANRSVAIVGSREPTEFGAEMARRLAALLAEDGYAVVSGLALGSDSAGHEGALDAGGVTVAVLSTPVEGAVYPRQNQGLAERIVEGGGALVSEYAPGVPIPQRQFASNLVARDEWEPALADGIIAVETSVKGGTKHALRAARDTQTPIAVFDYRSRHGVDFLGDPRFGGNVAYLREGLASPLFGPETVEAFKTRMDRYRSAYRNVHWDDGGGGETDAADDAIAIKIDQDGQTGFIL